MQRQKVAELADKLEQLLASVERRGRTHIPLGDVRDADGLLGPDELKKGRVLSTSGNFGVVFEGTLHGLPVAIKELKQEWSDKPGYKDKFLDEVRAMCTLRHPNVCQYRGYTTDPLSIVMDQYPHSLEDLVTSQTPLARGHCFRIAFQVSAAAQYLHEHSIMHRDLKCPNIFIDDNGDAKVGDFFLSKLVDQPTTEDEVIGTRLCMAPEMLNHQVFDLRAEVYSLGLVFYRLFSRHEMFSGVKTVEELKERQRRVPLFAVGEHELERAPQEMWDLIAQCCDMDPAKRPAIATIPTRIAHIAVRDCIPDSKRAQGHWLACTRGCFRERISLLQFAQASTQVDEGRLRRAVKAAVPHWDLITTDQFNLLSMWWPHFWCSRKVLNGMRAMVRSPWYAPSTEDAQHRLAAAPSNSFVVRPSTTSPLQFPFTVSLAEGLKARIERVYNADTRSMSYRCSLARGEFFATVADLVVFLMDQNDLVPAPPKANPLDSYQ